MSEVVGELNVVNDSVTERSPASKAVMAFQDGAISMDAMLSQCMPAIRRIAGMVADKYARRDIQDARDNMRNDLIQDLSIFLWEKIHLDYDRAIGNIENLIMRYAQNIALNSYQDREYLMHVNSGESVNTELMFEVGAGGHEGRERLEQMIDAIDEDPIDRIDRMDAKMIMREALMQNANLVADERRYQVTPSPERIQRRKAASEKAKSISISKAKQSRTPSSAAKSSSDKPASANRKLTPEQQELRDIMVELGMTQPEFAAALGLQEYMPRLASYLYGRTTYVDPEVMRQARELRVSGNLKHAKAKRFKDVPAKTVMLEWYRMLKLEPFNEDGTDNIDTLLQLVAILGVARSTVKRWWDGAMRPADQKLLDYEALVLAHLEKQAA